MVGYIYSKLSRFRPHKWGVRREPFLPVWVYRFPGGGSEWGLEQGKKEAKTWPIIMHGMDSQEGNWGILLFCNSKLLSMRQCVIATVWSQCVEIKEETAVRDCLQFFFHILSCLLWCFPENIMYNQMDEKFSYCQLGIWKWTTSTHDYLLYLGQQN